MHAARKQDASLRAQGDALPVRLLARWLGVRPQPAGVAGRAFGIEEIGPLWPLCVLRPAGVCHRLH